MWTTAAIDAIEKVCKKAYGAMIHNIVASYDAAEKYRYHYQEYIKMLRGQVERNN